MTSPIPGSEWNFFTYNLFNQQGSLHHYFRNPSYGVVFDPVLAGGINSPWTGRASIPEAAIPFGPNLTTAFSGGAKVRSDAPWVIMFDTADLVDPAKVQMSPAMSTNSTGELVFARLGLKELDINGVIRTRMQLEFHRNTHVAGKSVPFNLADIAPGEKITINMHGLMPNYA